MQIKLQDILVSSNTGLDAIKKAPIVVHETGIKCLRIQDITNKKKFEDWGNTEVLEKNFKRFQLIKGDIIIARTCSTGSVFHVKSDLKAVFNNGLARIRIKEDKCLPEFMAYILKNVRFQNFIDSRSHGTSVQKNIRLSDIGDFTFSLLSIEEQRRIVNVLGSIDKKIELNQKMNENLEETAKILFKSWFIDFDPVRAKAEGRPTGLSKEISDLFPDSFEDSELGEIPEGFKVDSVDNQYDISIGKTPPRKEPQWFSDKQQDIPWASIKDMGDAGVYINKTSEFLTNEAIEKFNIRVIPKNNVILSFKLTVGRVAILQKDMCTNEAIAHFVPKDNDLSKVFTYCLLKSIRYESLSSTSSIATAVNSKIIKAMKCIFPSKALLIAFNEFCRPIYKKIETNTNEIETLLSLRDTLLPKLISGELKIPDSESLIDEAGI